MRFWPRKPGDDIAHRLSAERPEPRSELLRAIEEGLETSHRPARRFRPTRTAYALGLTTAMMALLASFGGLSYAATSVGDSATRAAKIVKVTFGLKAAKPAKPSTSARKSASADRNGGSHTICHVPPGNPGNAQTLTLSEQGAQNHLQNHPLDYDGPCQPEPPECDDDDPDDDEYCPPDDDDDDDNHNRSSRR